MSARRRTPRTRGDMTLSRLGTLVRLHRRGLDGAGAELLEHLDVRRDELAAVLGVAPADLPLPGGPEQLPALAMLVDAKAAASKQEGALSRLREAEGAASRLAAESAFGLDGVELDLARLGELVAIGSFDLVGLRTGGEILALSRTLVAVLVREVSGVRLESLRVVPHERCLRVGWAGARSRGWFRLGLEAPDVRRTCVVVDLDAVHGGACDVAEREPSAATPWIDPRPRGPFAALAPRSP